MTSSTVLVTGSNGGLGSALVGNLLSQGIQNIACHYRSDKKRISSILEQYGLSPAEHCFRAELTNQEEVFVMRAEIEERMGAVTTLINIAGGSTNGMSWKLSKQDFIHVIDMNLTTTFLACQAFIPGMRRLGFGRIINVSSVVADIGAVGASHYAAAKAGINGLSRSLAIELIDKGITVNVMSLGYFDAGIIDTIPPALTAKIVSTIPAGRLGDCSSEIGALVRYLMSNESGYMTGQVLRLNGGLN